VKPTNRLRAANKTVCNKSSRCIARELAGLRARLGVVAVLGNHDYWFDAVRVTRALTNNG